jgi:thiamine pyrophosphate-dependent acetolactate synthase large subunit-like protein
MQTPLLHRRDVVAALVQDRGDMLVVSGLGSPTYDLMAAGDHDLNYYLWGAMGGAAMVGLGLALTNPDRSVLVVTGDGEMLMGMGSFATIAVQAPKNLTIAILDNGYYGETGMQLSHSGRGVKLEMVAQSVGFDWVSRITSMDAVADLRRRIQAKDSVNCAAIAIDSGEIDRVLPSRDGVYIKNRVKQALGQTL